MPREITDTVYISSHKGHDLRLGREIVFVFLFGSRFRSWSILVFIVPRWAIGPGRSQILSDQRFGKQDGIQLDAQPDLESGGTDGPELTGS